MLKIKNLKKYFTNSAGEKLNIINIPEFTVEDKEITAVSGESGSGKSTFLNLISGILNPGSGEIYINGTDITKLSESKKDYFRAKNIGYIFQSFNLLQGFNALENVMLGMMFSGKADKKKSETVLAKVGLHSRMKNKPQELSVGEQQRVAVARAMVNSPLLILADEPTANLDSKNTEIIIDLIKNICSESGTALITVSHEEYVVSQFSNKIFFSEINII